MNDNCQVLVFSTESQKNQSLLLVIISVMFNSKSRHQTWRPIGDQTAMNVPEGSAAIQLSYNDEQHRLGLTS